MKGLIVRLLLTAGLLYGVYTETGIWTVITLALCVISIEAITYLLRKRQ